MKIFWFKFREFLVPIGMLGLFVALGYFGIFRVFEKNHEKMIAIQRAKADQKMLEEQRNEISNMRKEVEYIRSASDRLDVFLPKDRIISLVEMVESIGKEFSVSVVSEASSAPALAVPIKKKAVKKTPSSEESKVEEGGVGTEEKKEEKEKESLASLLPEERSIFITFKATGTYQNTIAFLQKLDAMPVLLDVLSVEMTPAELEEKENRSVVPAPVQGVGINPFDAKNSLPEAVLEEPNRVQASFQTVLYTTP